MFWLQSQGSWQEGVQWLSPYPQCKDQTSWCSQKWKTDFVTSGFNSRKWSQKWCVLACVCVCMCVQGVFNLGAVTGHISSQKTVYFLFILFPNPNHLSDCHLLGLGFFKSISEPGSKPGRPTVSQKLTTNYTPTLSKHSNKLVQSPCFSLVGLCVYCYLSPEKGTGRWAGAQQWQRTAQH